MSTDIPLGWPGMYFAGRVGGRWIIVAGIFAVAASGFAADTANWREVLALPPEPAGQTNAFPRWMAALESRPELNLLEHTVLETLPEDPPAEAVLTSLRALLRGQQPALAAFTVEADEYARFPDGFGMGRGLPGPEVWMELARLKALEVRVSWWTGRRATAAAAAVDLVRAGGAAAREALGLRDWVTWMQIAAQGFDSALWIARQLDVTDDELATLSRALREATGAWPAGAANALRGEFAFSFRGAVEHLPETDDIVTALGALADFGLPQLPAGAADQLGTAPGPLLDHEATLALYGEALAHFITTITNKPVWQHAVFGADFERESELWLADIGLFGELALNRGLDEYPAEQLPEVEAALRRATNPLGKLMVVYAATNFDAVAYEGLRVEAHRRCAFLLVEWRRRILRMEELPATAAAWKAEGVSSRELEDPFTGDTLFFDAENLRIWSVGPDGMNNRGSGDPGQSPDGADFGWSLSAAP